MLQNAMLTRGLIDAMPSWKKFSLESWQKLFKMQTIQPKIPCCPLFWMMFHLRSGLYFFNAMKSSLGLRGFITIFSWKATAFHRQAKLFDLNLFRRKTRCPKLTLQLVNSSSAWSLMKLLLGPLSTAVKRLSMREKLHGDRIVQF